MFILVKNKRREYILLGLDNDSSSKWQHTPKRCFEYWDNEDLHTWTSITSKEFPCQLLYLEKHYAVVGMYRRSGDTFNKLNLLTTEDDFPEYLL